MSAADFGRVSVAVLLLLLAAHIVGWCVARMRQPRVIGEIVGGIVLGPSLLGLIGSTPSARFHVSADALGFLYQFGLVLLMFSVGCETKGLGAQQDRREVGWLASVGTIVPFVVMLVASPLLPLDRFLGAARNRGALLLVLCVAVSVTSIPVISRIFIDLGIAQTRFARVVLSVAILDDVALLAILAVALAMPRAENISAAQFVGRIAAALGFFILGLTVFRSVTKRLTHAKWNVLARDRALAWVAVVLLAYTSLATSIGVNAVFAGFLAGYALNTEVDPVRRALDSLNEVSLGLFVPIYFGMVGLQLDLPHSFSFGAFIFVLLGACVFKITAVGLGARLAALSWRETWNVAVALNARGGPGIVLASLAMEARIINQEAYTILVLLALVTSSAAGTWLESVIRRGQPLLRDNELGADGDGDSVSAGVQDRAPLTARIDSGHGC
jgi:K+:H+ antiporter